MTQPTRCSKHLSKSTKKDPEFLYPDLQRQLKDWHFLAEEPENNSTFEDAALSAQGSKDPSTASVARSCSAAATRSCHKGPFPRAQIGAASKRKVLTWVRGLAFAARLRFFSKRRGVISLHHHQSKEKVHNWLATRSSAMQCFYIRVQQTRSPRLCHQLVYD